MIYPLLHYMTIIISKLFSILLYSIENNHKSKFVFDLKKPKTSYKFGSVQQHNMTRESTIKIIYPISHLFPGKLR